jgi:RimJ/RimL family protein N-acetyltransferase
MKSGISLDSIKSPDEALEMSACRNQVRTFMTHNDAEILPEQQLEWYRDTYIPSHEAGELYGFVVRDGIDPIGYGLISLRDEKWWVSGGLIADARGKGAGHFLFEQMTLIAHEDLHADEVWLDVLRGNERAINLYRKLGYVAVEDTADLLVMVHRWEEQEQAA